MSADPNGTVAGAIPPVPRKGSALVKERLAFLNATQRYAVLATSLNDQPHTSLVAFAVTPDNGGIVFATSMGTRKFGNIMANRNVSFLIDSRTNAETDYLAAEAMTLTGTARVVRRGRVREAMADLLRSKHQALSGFISAPETAIILAKIEIYQHVGTFQTVTTVKAGRPSVARGRSKEVTG